MAHKKFKPGELVRFSLQPQRIGVVLGQYCQTKYIVSNEPWYSYKVYFVKSGKIDVVSSSLLEKLSPNSS